MYSPNYVHLRIPGRGQVTLSIPGGVRRALKAGRLPPTADVWVDPIGAWIPMGRHPALGRLQAIPPVAAPVKPLAPPPLRDELAIERFSAEHLIVSELEEAQEEPLLSRLVLAGGEGDRTGISAFQRWASSL